MFDLINLFSKKLLITGTTISKAVGRPFRLIYVLREVLDNECRNKKKSENNN